MTVQARRGPLSSTPAGRNRIGVALLVVNAEAEVLLCGCAEGWALPGGEIHPGEAAEHALNRELLAATGLAPRSPFLLTLISGPDTYRKLDSGEDVYDLTAVYVVRDWAGAAPCPGGRFFPLDALPAPASTTDRHALQELRCCWGIC